MLNFNENKVTIDHFHTGTKTIAFYTFQVILSVFWLRFFLHFSSF
jgi:hypothetical protein